MLVEEQVGSGERLTIASESIFRGVAESPTAPTQYKWQANGWLA